MWGKCNKPVTMSGEGNDLGKGSLGENFFERSRFAGNGNAGHIISLPADRRREGIAAL